MKVACWEYTVWSTLSFLRTSLKKKETQLVVPRPRVANKMQAAFLDSWPTHKSVGRRGGDSSVSRGAWADEAGCIFSHESSRDLLRAKKPEDDSYKGRVQRSLEDRMMRMMRARRTTFSGNNMSADLDENFNLNLRWRLRFQASIVRWNRCCRWDEKLSSDGLEWCTSLRLGSLWKALSRHPRQVQKAWKHPTSTIQVYIFWRKLSSNLLWSTRWKANTWRSLLQQPSGLCMWRSSTEDIGPWDERRTITKGKGRHRIQEGSTSRGCMIGRQRFQVLWWTDQRSHRIIFGRRLYWQKSWKCWVIIKGIDSPSLEPWNLEKLRELPSPLEKDQLQQDKTNKVSAHDKQIRFLQMVRSSKAHVILVCEAGSVKPYETYLAEFGWTLCLTDAESLFVPSLTWARRKYPTDCRSKRTWSIKKLFRTKEERLLCNLWDQVGTCDMKEGVCCILHGILVFARLGDYDACKDGYNKNLWLSCRQWRCR